MLYQEQYYTVKEAIDSILEKMLVKFQLNFVIENCDIPCPFLYSRLVRDEITRCTLWLRET